MEGIQHSGHFLNTATLFLLASFAPSQKNCRFCKRNLWLSVIQFHVFSLLAHEGMVDIVRTARFDIFFFEPLHDPLENVHFKLSCRCLLFDLLSFVVFKIWLRVSKFNFIERIEDLWERLLCFKRASFLEMLKIHLNYYFLSTLTQ